MYAPTPTPVVKRLFGRWLLTENESEREEINVLMKSQGFHAYEDGEGYPICSHWWNGPITKNNKFFWNPRTSSEGHLECRVTRITTEGKEPMIWSRVWGTRDKEVPNEESHFRACAVEAGRMLERKYKSPAERYK